MTWAHYDARIIAYGLPETMNTAAYRGRVANDADCIQIWPHYGPNALNGSARRHCPADRKPTHAEAEACIPPLFGHFAGGKGAPGVRSVGKSGDADGLDCPSTSISSYNDVSEPLCARNPEAQTQWANRA
jgi:hypothetical protein